MKRLLTIGALLLTACIVEQASVPDACQPPGWDRARLEALEAASFEIADPAERAAFARAITGCLASPDPVLRDRIAFGSLSHMLRADQLDVATRAALVEDLLPRLASADPEGFERPFAALALSELARAERLDGRLGDTVRSRLLDGATGYFVAVRDYRGFDALEGWRHGVAHGADFLMQLALNPSLGRDELARIRDAVATQVAPVGHFYVYGEPERLARPILVMADRGIFTTEEWRTWFEQIASPAPLASWDEAFSSQNGLAKRHDTLAFLQAIWLNAGLSESTGIRALLPGAEAALRALP